MTNVQATALCLTLLLAGVISSAGEKKETAAVPKPRGHALLIGVTAYPNLNKELWLEGGANDVVLLKKLLVTKYGFSEENIHTLSEIEGQKDEKRLPTRANIERECKALAQRVKSGERAVVLMSGHGSRMPEAKDTKDPQPDGFDKIFLPRDVKNFDLSAGAVPNAITGRELGAWLRPIPQNKASLWLIMDSCHSGSAVRGHSERTRQIDAESVLKIPAKVMEEAQERAKKRDKPRGSDVPVGGPIARLDGVVLTYACLSKQTTLEGSYKHPETGERMPFGLLTHTLCSILLASDDALTYRELLVRVQNQYKQDDRDTPSPVIEGAAQQNAILGDKAPPRSTLALRLNNEKLTVNGGQLHGLTKGTILAVYPPAGQKGGVRGYVEITKLAPIRSEVVPVEYEKMKALTGQDLADGRCEVAEVVYDGLKLKVAVDVAGSKAQQKDLSSLAKEIDALAKEKATVVEVVDPIEADWLVRISGDEIYLLPRAEWQDERGGKESRRLGPAPDGDKRAVWLHDSFAKITRVLNLLKLAKSEVSRGTEDEFRARVAVEMERPGEKKRDKGEPDSIKTFYHGDEVRFKVHNPTKVPIDVTILYVNSKFGISPLLPSKDESNRVEPGKTVAVPPVDIDEETAGREFAVVIAVKAEGDLTDFVALAQPDIKGALQVAKQRGEKGRGLNSGLGHVLRDAMFPGHGHASVKPRAKRREIENFTADVIPVQVIAGKRPADEK